jgi:glycerate 2-kinase
VAHVSIGDSRWQVRASQRLRHDLIRSRERIIRNGGSPANQNARKSCLDALEEALDAVDPYRCVRSSMRVTSRHLIVGNIIIPLSRSKGILVLAVGKAAASMMRAALEILRKKPIRGILVCSKDEQRPALDSRVEIFRSGHPIPDQAGLEASRSVIQAVGDLNESDVLLCLISGGASAMLPAPMEGITIHDKITMTGQLLRSAATIHETNTVRRHLSKLKGGRLIELCRASTILSLIISDVPGNHLPDIGSGLTAEDPTSYHDAVQVLRRHDLWQKTPSRIKNLLLNGVRGTIAETPKPGNPAFRRVHNVIIADNETACKAAQRALRRKKLQPRTLSTSVELEARDMGKLLATVAAKSAIHADMFRRWNAMIVGGECVVRVAGRGEGGRNQEVALSAVKDIKGLDGCVIAAFGTDGIDGNTKAAGAIVDGNTARRAKLRELDPNDFLSRNDSGTFFKLLGDALVTGSTGTNVGDIYIMIALG